MLNEFAKDTLITLSTGKAAGTGNVDGAILDMAGYDAVTFLAVLSTSKNAGVATLTPLLGSATSDMNVGTTNFDVKFTSTGVAKEHALGLDVIHPTHRYVQPRLGRATQNISLHSIVAIQHRQLKSPTTAHGSTAGDQPVTMGIAVTPNT